MIANEKRDTACVWSVQSNMLKTLPSAEIVQIFSSFSVHSSVTVQLPDSTVTGSNIGGIISGVSVTLILIITASAVVTSLIVYIVLRYIMFNHTLRCQHHLFF